MAGIIAVANQKGGVGKTATTANLGTAISRLGHRVLIVDMDPQGNLTASFGVQDRICTTTGKALLDPRADVAVVNLRDGQEGGLDLLPERNASLAEAEALTELRTSVGAAARIARIDRQVAEIMGRWDF